MDRSWLSPAALLAAALLVASCATTTTPKAPPAPPRGEPLEPVGGDTLPVREAGEPIVVAAWAEPRELPAGGGQAQILVRVQKESGPRFPGVEVRLRASSGSLFSGGRVLVTDEQGMTRDRLTAHKSTTVTLNAGGTRYRIEVPVGERAP